MSSKKLTAMIDEEVMREVKARAAMRGMSITQVVEVMLKRWIEEDKEIKEEMKREQERERKRKRAW
jgi:antitoxin component of RelBE/YafQ-DinJ toxin-antitoxin module